MAESNHESHFINIAGTVCPPEIEPAFHKWYDEWHIPNNMKFEGMERVTRYRLLKPIDHVEAQDYPGFITIYRFKDAAAFQAWNLSPQLAEARKGLDELAAKGMNLLCRVQYESILSQQDTSPMAVINVVGVQCPTESEAKLDKYYSEKHVPDALKLKEVLGVTRYRLAGSVHFGAKTTREIKVKEYPRFMTIYYFKNVASVEAYDTNPQRADAREDWVETARQLRASSMWRARYEPMGTWRR
jgi:hypothetical protein